MAFIVDDQLIGQAGDEAAGKYQKMRSLKAQLMGMVSGKTEKPRDSTNLPDSGQSSPKNVGSEKIIYQKMRSLKAQLKDTGSGSWPGSRGLGDGSRRLEGKRLHRFG